MTDVTTEIKQSIVQLAELTAAYESNSGRYSWGDIDWLVPFPLFRLKDKQGWFATADLASYEASIALLITIARQLNRYNMELISSYLERHLVQPPDRWSPRLYSSKHSSSNPRYDDLAYYEELMNIFLDELSTASNNQVIRAAYIVYHLQIQIDYLKTIQVELPKPKADGQESTFFR